MRRSARCGLLLLLGAFASGSWGQGAGLDEDGLRAAFVLRLAQFTQWPSSVPVGPSLWLCAAGLQSGGIEAVQALANRAVGSAQVKVRVLKEPAEAGHDCQVLLLGQADAAALRPWMLQLGNSPVLVVATSPEALRAGVSIALISEPQGMAFSVNHAESRRRGLVLAAPVLKLAREVR